MKSPFYLPSVFVLLLLNTSLRCLGQGNDADLADDNYNDLTDREIILTLVKRIEGLEKSNINLEIWNRNQHTLIENLKATVQSQKSRINQLENGLESLKQSTDVSVESVEFIAKEGGHDSVNASADLEYEGKEKGSDPVNTPADLEYEDKEEGADSVNTSADLELEGDDETEGEELSDEDSGTIPKVKATSKRRFEQDSQQSIKGRSRASRQAESGGRVAFFATTIGKLTQLGAGQVLEFPNVTTNIGNGYNPRTGIFTAPCGGVYVFSATLMGNSHNHANYYIAKNHVEVALLYIRGIDSPYTSATHSVVLQLSQGDDVEVRNTDAGEGVYGDRLSSFSGFLLYDGDVSAAIVG